MQNQRDLKTASAQDHTTSTLPEARHGWRWQWKSPKWRLSPPTCTECLVCMHCMQHETPGADLQCSICCSEDRRHFRSSHVASPCHAPGGQVAIGIMCVVLKKGVHRHQGACARAFVRAFVRACVRACVRARKWSRAPFETPSSAASQSH